MTCKSEPEMQVACLILYCTTQTNFSVWRPFAEWLGGYINLAESPRDCYKPLIVWMLTKWEFKTIIHKSFAIEHYPMHIQERVYEYLTQHERVCD